MKFQIHARNLIPTVIGISRLVSFTYSIFQKLIQVIYYYIYPLLKLLIIALVQAQAAILDFLFVVSLYYRIAQSHDDIAKDLQGAYVNCDYSMCFYVLIV